MKSEIKQTLSSISEQTSNSDTVTKLCFLYILYKLLKLICRLPHNDDNFEANGQMACTLNLYKHTFQNDNIDTCIRKIFNHIFLFSTFKKNTFVITKWVLLHVIFVQPNTTVFTLIYMFHCFMNLKALFIWIFINDMFIFLWKVWEIIMHRNLTILLFCIYTSYSK